MARADNNIDIFLNELLAGKSQRQAFYIAYPNSKKWKDVTVDNRASELLKKSEVAARYNKLLEKYRDKSIIERNELLRMAVKGVRMAIGEEYSERELIKIINDGEGNEKEISNKSKLKGTDLKSLRGLIEVIAKMEGFIVDKVEHSGNIDSTINIIPARSK